MELEKEKKLNYKKRDFIYVYPGDEVVVKFHSKDPRTATILTITERYEYCNYGTSRVCPLVKAIFNDTFKIESFDAGYITEVLCRSGVTPKNVNLYTGDYHEILVKTTKSELKGELIDLVCFALSKLPYELNRRIDNDNVAKLYLKSKAGLRGSSHPIYGRMFKVESSILGTVLTVRKKPFMKWVKKNYNQLMMSAHKLRKHGTELSKMYEDDYWKSVDEDNMVLVDVDELNAMMEA